MRSRRPLQTPFLVAMDENFRVGMIGAKPMAGLHKLRSQSGVIVDFTIEGDDYASVLIRHGLIGSNADIDDGQAAVPEAYLAIV